MRRILLALLALAAFVLGVPITSAAATTDVIRLAGESRTATAAAVAAHSHPDGAETVVIARADAYADALAGGPLARKLDAPILLTGSDRLDAVTAAQVARLGATHAVVLGGTTALSERVVADLGAAGIAEVERIAGASRFETAAAVARRVGGTAAFLAEGANADPARGWPDALAASSLAAAQGMPILLTAGDALPAATAAALAGADAVTVVGGPAAVPDSVVAEVRAVGATVERIAGATRYETSALVAERAVAAGLTPAWVGSGRSWPDALVAGPAAAAEDAAVVLVDGADLAGSPATADLLAEHDAERLVVVGGPGAVSQGVVDALVAGHGAHHAPAPAPPPPTAPAPPTTSSDPVDLSDAQRWSDLATWGGAVPKAGEVVTVPAGQTVLLDVSPPALGGLQVDGTLAFAEADLTLTSRWIMVHGRLAIGAPGAPFQHHAEIVLQPVAGDDVMGMGAGVLGVMGGTLDLHGRVPAPAWTRLAQTAPAGTNTLHLQQPVDWRPGDRIVVASTDIDPHHAEELTVAGIDGATVTLTEPLTHTHWGTGDVLDGKPIEQRAEVGLLSRNVVVRGPADAPDGLGGHLMAMAGGRLRIAGAEVTGMGQRGILARYPIHFHLLGSAPESYVRGASVHHNYSRCITTHGTSDVEISDTVAFETFGHCIFFEDGVETGVKVLRNLVLGTRVPPEGARILDTDAEPASYWIQHPDNIVEGNAAAGSEGIGFWYDLPEHPTGLSATEEFSAREAPMGSFANNVAHSTVSQGWESGVGLRVDDYEAETEAVFAGLIAYKNEGHGVWLEGNTAVVGATLSDNARGFLGIHSSLRDSTVVGRTSNAAERTWATIGVQYYWTGMHVRDVTFVNFPETVDRGPSHAIDFGADLVQGHADIAGARFVNAPSTVQVPGPHDDDGRPRSPVIHDLDGSVTGTGPGVIVGPGSLQRDADCTARPEWNAYVCPATDGYGLVIVNDLGDDSPVNAATLTRDDGAVAAVLAGDHDQPELRAVLPFGRFYEVETSRPLSGHVEVVLASENDGWVDIALPWSAPTAHVYDGWGRWHPVPALAGPGDLSVGSWFDAVAGILHVRIARNPDDDWWNRVELCSLPFCGEDGPG